MEFEDFLRSLKISIQSEVRNYTQGQYVWSPGDQPYPWWLYWPGFLGGRKTSNLLRSLQSVLLTYSCYFDVKIKLAKEIGLFACTLVKSGIQIACMSETNPDSNFIWMWGKISLGIPSFLPMEGDHSNRQTKKHITLKTALFKEPLYMYEACVLPRGEHTAPQFFPPRSIQGFLYSSLERKCKSILNWDASALNALNDKKKSDVTSMNEGIINAINVRLADKIILFGNKN